ncbi:MAG: tetratricopeptide repeat protein, partial [Candidatus Latescibacteria bacterium]|nr:tetratricopeptide repeat protein [Candidatus Latescibacterota bacterium]
MDMMTRYIEIIKSRSYWLLGLTALVLVVSLVSPSRLAKGDRQDPIFKIESFISQGEYGPALRQLNRLDTAKLDAWDLRKVTLQRAVCQMYLGNENVALRHFNQVVKDKDVISDYMAFWMGQCSEKIGQVDSAVVYYRKVMDMSPTSSLRSKSVLKAATLSMEQKKYGDAVMFYDALIGKSTEEDDAWAGKIKALMALGDSVGAREARLQLIREYPQHVAAKQALQNLDGLVAIEEVFVAGVAHMKNKKYRQAKALFRRVLKESDDKLWQGRAQYELGHVYYKSRQYRSAEKAFDRAFKVYGEPLGLFNLGRCAIKRGHDLTAATRFKEFVKRYPNMAGAADALWQTGMAYQRRGRHRDARKMFLQLAERYPKSKYADQAAWRAGFALFKTRQYTAASKAFLGLAGRTDEGYMRDQGYYWAGKCFQRLGKDEEAQFWIGRASEGFPASYYSARARAVLGGGETAYPQTTDGAPLIMGQSYEPSMYLRKGDMLASVGLYRQAEKEYDRARAIHTGNLFALDDLLQRYERIRSMHKALQVSGAILMLERKQGVPMTMASFRRLFPTYYWGEISHTAQQMDLDPNLMIAIMRQESAFNHEARSRVGARGLMQVMPSTGKAMP